MLRRRVRQSLLETALAATAYKRDHGMFPAEIAEITPRYLDRIPLDEFDRDGGTLRYQRDLCQRAAVWSTGVDGIDGNCDFQGDLPRSFVFKNPSIFVRRKARPTDFGFWFR